MALKNEYVTLPEGELLSTNIHSLRQLSRYNLKQYALEQVFTCGILFPVIAATVKRRFRAVALSSGARNLFYFLWLRTWKVYHGIAAHMEQ